jgi:hypothetical protein
LATAPDLAVLALRQSAVGTAIGRGGWWVCAQRPVERAKHGQRSAQNGFMPAMDGRHD